MPNLLIKNINSLKKLIQLLEEQPTQLETERTPEVDHYLSYMKNFLHIIKAELAKAEAALVAEEATPVETTGADSSHQEL